MEFLTRDGKADAGQESKLAELKAKLAAGNGKMLLHLHGGLVKEEDGLAIAKRLAGSSDQPVPGQPDQHGLGLGADWTQVFVVWRTGGFETVRTNWTELAQNDRLYQIILEKLIEFIGGKYGAAADGSRSVGAAATLTPEEIRRRITGKGDKRNPFADLEKAGGSTPGSKGPAIPQKDDGELALEFENLLALDPDFNAAVGDIDAHVNAKATGRTAPSAGVIDRGEKAYSHLNRAVTEPIETLRPDGTPTKAGPVGVAAFMLKHAGKIAFRCFKRFRNRRDHGFHATIVEELAREMYGDFIGASVWGFMKNDAIQHFEADGFGLSLLDAIPDDKPVHLIVTAHSAGSIWATAMLKKIAATKKNIKLDLLLLAPAVRADFFASMLEETSDQIDRCRMYAMNDATERADALLGHDKGYIYPSSLLYMVSGLFEQDGASAVVDAPILGMQRFMTADFLSDETAEAQKAINAFFQQPGHDVVYSPLAGVTLSDSHGGFDSEKVTLRSVAGFFS